MRLRREVQALALKLTLTAWDQCWLQEARVPRGLVQPWFARHGTEAQHVTTERLEDQPV
jgi:hypothetical protein